MNDVRADPGQDAILKDILEGREDVFIKLVEDSTFDPITGKRNAFVGYGVVKNWNSSWPNDTQANSNFIVTGCGPLDCREDNEESKDFVCFCEDQITNVYMQHLDFYTPPNAPVGSIGWTVEAEFVGVTTGTGNIGTYQLIGVLPNTLNGCPVYVSFRYFCVNSAVIPSGGGTALEDFLEIAETTLNEDQIAILDAIQEAIGFRYPDDSWMEIFVEFNLNFLIANPTFELDLSGLGMSDLSLLNTLTNLKHVNLNDNKINGFGIQQMDRLNLETLKLKTNAVGMNDSAFLSPMLGTLKHVDLSNNNLQEMYGWLGSTATLDFLDISDNVIASNGWNANLKIKDFRFNNNVYPETVGFWAALKFDGSSAIKIVSQLWDQSLTENFEMFNTELNDPVADPTTLINKIAADKGITFAEAEALTTLDPSWIDIENSVGHVPYDPTILK